MKADGVGHETTPQLSLNEGRNFAAGASPPGEGM
jgi:hypothetical protein